MKNFKDIIRKPYYFVPPCPQCGSPVTGRYVAMRMCKEWIIEDSLRHGEYVRQADVDDQRGMAFCLNCNFEWPEDVPVRWITLRDISHQKIIRHTAELLDTIKTIKKNKKQKSWFDNWFNLF